MNNAEAHVYVAFHAGKGSTWRMYDVRSDAWTLGDDLQECVGVIDEAKLGYQEHPADDDENSLRTLVDKYGAGANATLIAGVDRLPYHVGVNFVDGQWHATSSFNRFNLPVTINISATKREDAIKYCLISLLDTVKALPV